MLLYRYFGSHAEETIERGLMKVAKPSELNDPFEFMYEATGKASLKAAADLLKVTMASPIARATLAEDLGARSNAELNKIIRKNRPRLLRGLKESHDKRADELISGVLERADRQWRLISFTGETTDASEILMWSHYAAKHSGVRIAFEMPQTADGFIIEKVQYADPPTLRVPLSKARQVFENRLMAVQFGAYVVFYFPPA